MAESTTNGTNGHGTNGHGTPAPAAATYPATDSPIGNIASLHNKVALITGGSSGLGRAIAQAYAAAGAYIVSADLQEPPPRAPVVEAALNSDVKSGAAVPATELDFSTPTVELVNRRWPARAEDANASGVKGRRETRAIFVKADVTAEESVENMVKTAVETYGRLDIMVNCAGISAESQHRSTSGSLARIHETPVSILDASLAVNVRGVWLGTKHAVRQFLTQEAHPTSTSRSRGWIINLASILASTGLTGASSYCASKGAVLNLTRATALEYAADKIHINAIQPGFTDTHFLETLYATAPGGREGAGKQLNVLHPWGRTGRAEDIARVAVFLAGDGVSWVTGSSIVVDGGYLAQ